MTRFNLVRTNTENCGKKCAIKISRLCFQALIRDKKGSSNELPFFIFSDFHTRLNYDYFP